FSSDGKITSKKLDRYSSKHSFVFNQLGGEIILADNHYLDSYSLNGEKKWSIYVNSLIPSSFRLLNFADGSTDLMISSSEDLFYLINQKGEIEKGFPLDGGLFPTLIKDQRQMLFSGNSDGMIHVFA